jgi:hypothetical protein
MVPLRRHAALLLSGSLAVTVLFAVGAQSAGAASKKATFCNDVAKLVSVPTPALPTSNSLSAINTAVSRLPNEITTLNKDHVALVAGSADAPSTALASVYRTAAAQVALESADLTSMIKDVEAVLAHPKEDSTELALAKDMVSATTAAATATAYLNVDHSTVVKACR